MHATNRYIEIAPSKRTRGGDASGGPALESTQLVQSVRRTVRKIVQRVPRARDWRNKVESLLQPGGHNAPMLEQSACDELEKRLFQKLPYPVFWKSVRSLVYSNCSHVFMFLSVCEVLARLKLLDVPDIDSLMRTALPCKGASAHKLARFRKGARSMNQFIVTMISHGWSLSRGMIGTFLCKHSGSCHQCKKNY